MKPKEIILKLKSLSEALQTKNTSLLSTIYNEQKTPDADLCEEDGNRSIAYYAAAYEMTEALTFLLAKGASINKLMEDIKAPASTIKKLSTSNHSLTEAALLNNIALPLALKEMDENLTTDEQTAKIWSETLKASRRLSKKGILAKGPIDSIGSSIPAIAALEAAIYSDDPSYAKQHFEKKLAAFYDCDLLKPLIEVLAIAAAGQHDFISPKNKKLKILALSKEKYSKFTPLSEIFTPWGGHYTNKNTLFISLGVEPNIALGTLLHEGTHFIMRQVFNNKCNPFFPGDSGKEAEKEMMEVIKITADRVTRKLRHPQDEDVKAALESIKSIFDHYPVNKHAIEMAVKIPEILGRLGVEKGSKFLKKFPELVKYHREIIIPAINNYLSHHKLPLEIAPSSPKINDSLVKCQAKFFQPAAKLDNIKSNEKELLTKLKELGNLCLNYQAILWKDHSDGFLEWGGTAASRKKHMESLTGITHGSWRVGIYAQKYLLIDSLLDIIKRDDLSSEEKTEEFQEKLMDDKNFLIRDEKTLREFANYQKAVFLAEEVETKKSSWPWSTTLSPGETFVEKTKKILEEINKLTQLTPDVRTARPDPSQTQDSLHHKKKQ